MSDLKELKIGLLTKGVSVSPAAREKIGGAQGAPLTLADYASTSGIALKLEGDVFVNAPIQDHNPNFVGKTPYLLDYDCGFFVSTGDECVDATPIPVPAYHSKRNAAGETYTSFAITHTDRVRISPVQGCAIACTFCDLPYKERYHKQAADDLVDSVRVALIDSVLPARHILISGGTPRPEDYAYEQEVYRAVAEAFPDTNINVMMVPMPGLLDAGALRECGISGLSINLELYSEEAARKTMRSKWKVSRKRYLDFIEGAAQEFGEGRVRSLLMVGLEPLEDTLRGVAALAERGCDPVLSPFRPDPATPLRGSKPPGEEFLIEAYERSREIVSRHSGVALGPRCIPCMHNTLTFPEEDGPYFYT